MNEGPLTDKSFAIFLRGVKALQTGKSRQVTDLRHKLRGFCSGGGGGAEWSPIMMHNFGSTPPKCRVGVVVVVVVVVVVRASK